MFEVETEIEYCFRNSATGKARRALNPTPELGDSITSIEVNEMIAGVPDFPNRYTINFNDTDQTATLRKGSGEPRVIEGDTYLQVQAIQRAFAEIAQLGTLPPDKIEEMRTAKFTEELDKVLPQRNGLQKVAAGLRRFNICLASASPSRTVVMPPPPASSQRKNNI